MYSIATNIYIKPGHEVEFVALSKNIIELSKKEDYIFWIDMLQSVDVKTEFVLYETFATEQDQEKHLAQPYMHEWIINCRNLFSDNVFKVPSHISCVK